MLNDLLTVNIQYNEYHLVFPRIILAVLLILLAAIGIQRVIKSFKNGTLKRPKFNFWAENYDRRKLFGTVGLLLVYVFFLEFTGFILSSIIFMFVLTILLRGDLKRNTLVISLINSVATSVLAWFFFGYLFDITLP